MDFYSQSNFKLAYSRLKTVKRDYYVDLYLRDWQNFGLDLEDNIKTLIHDIREEIYKPEIPLKLYIPKANKLIRPITVLNFFDLLTYQAIANIIAEKIYPEISSYYNREVFGNIYDYKEQTPSNFFFVKWEKQWEEFERKTKAYYNQGFKYILDFDIASFYDTLDHHLLETLLKNHNIPEELIKILSEQLTTWTKDDARNNHQYKHGIPQGPQPSSLLSELYLHSIDEQMRKLKQKHRDFEYIRYVDDIRVFAKTERGAYTYFAYLDLLARDIGLIPQASKTSIREIENIKDIVKINEYFSAIKMEKKSKGKLTEQQNKYLIINLLQELSKENPDKTVIRFILYKIDKNEDVKSSLIKNLHKIPNLFEDVCTYLSKFKGDAEVEDWVSDELQSNPLYTWTLAVVLKYFIIPEKIIPIWNKYSKERKNWYIQFFLLRHISKNKPEFLNQICALSSELCPIVRKVLFIQKYKLASTMEIKNDILQQMCTDADLYIALEGKQLLFEQYACEQNFSYIDLLSKLTNNVPINRYLQSALVQIGSDFIIESLSRKDIGDAEALFLYSRWDDKIYERLKWEYKSAINLFETTPWGIWIIHMDNFNALIVEHLLTLADIPIPKGLKYGTMLTFENFFKTNFPVAFRIFDEIHNYRSTRVAHPKDKEHQVTTPLTWSESNTLQSKEFLALKDICESFYLVFKNTPKITSAILIDSTPVKDEL